MGIGSRVMLSRCFDKSLPFFFARLGGGRDTKRADVKVHSDSVTENEYSKAQWILLWSVLLLMYPAALRSTTSGIGIIFI